MTNEPSLHNVTDPDDAMPDPVVQLQKRVRRLSWGLAVVLLIALAATFKAFENRSSRREYVLVDDNGSPRAVLGVREGNPFFSLFDSGGESLVSLSGGEAGPMLRFSNPDSSMHAVLMVQAQGVGLSLLGDHDSGIQLLVDDRDARIHFLDHTGWLRLGMGTDDGRPYLGFMATNLASRIVMGSDEDGGLMSFFDGQGERRLSLGVHDGRPFLNPVTPDRENASDE